MPKRLGNTQIPSAAGLSDIINLKQHKQYVEQDIFPSPDNDVLSGLRFDGSSYLSRPFTGGNQLIHTISMWVKRATLTPSNHTDALFSAGAPADTNRVFLISYESSQRLNTWGFSPDAFNLRYQRRTSSVYRDLSAWYHIVMAIDYTNQTGNDRVKLYVNGAQITSFDTQTTTDASSGTSAIGHSYTYYIGRYAYASQPIIKDCYLANIHFIDGQALDPSHFGYYNRSSRQWKPKKYSGTYGGNGFYLPFNTNVYRYFNGAASVNLSGSPITTFPCTVSCWVNLNDVGGTYGQIINLNVGGTRASIFYNYNDNGSFTGDQASTFTICIGLQNHFSTENLRTYPNSGWHHLAVVFKSGTNVTPDVYIDGEFVSPTNRGLSHGGTGVNAIGSNGSSAEYLSGYITNVAYFDNYTITQEEVTEIFNSGLDGDLTELSITQPNSYLKLNEKTGTTVAATLGTITGTATNSMITNSLDFSGNHNDWTPIGFSGHDTVPDSPTNNFASLNPLYEVNTNVTYSEGNLKHSCTSSTADISTSTLAVSAGKYYWEILFTSSNSNSLFGIENRTENSGYGGTRSGWRSSGSLDNLTGSVSSGWSSNNVLGVLLNLDNGEVTFYENNLSKGTLTIVNWVAGSQYLAWVGNDSSTLVANFGQDPTFAGTKSPTTTYTDANGIGSFYYQPPNGALALCTANLSRSVIEDPADYFKAVKYVGDYSSPATISVGFNPDLVWIKQRTPYASQSHCIYDSVRGVSKRLYSDSTSQEITPDGNGGVTNFSDNNGFELTRPTNQAFEGYDSSMQMIAWCWKAGGNSNTFNINGTGYSTYSALQTDNTSLPAITSGMITPSGMSINTDAGFSIVKYTGNATAGASVVHGLGQKPDCIIVKRLTGTVMNWGVYHQSLASNEILQLDVPDDVYADSGVFNGTQPTSSVFYLGETTAIDNASADYIAYCWHSVEGYSKFGSYTGNGSSDGPFVYTGFRPAFVMIKNTNTNTSNWYMFDSARNTYNVTNRILFPNGNDAESTNNLWDFTSNGFKLRSTDGGANLSGHTIIYMAFAEQPFNYANAR